MKLLVWNIEKFTDGKFLDQEGHLAANRISYMENVITGSNHPECYPDVIAIIEVLADNDTILGRPLNKPDSSGIIQMLNYVKFWTNNRNWRLVPPLKCNPPNTGPRAITQPEVIGVLYNKNIVEFVGPDTRPDSYPSPWNLPEITDNTNRSGKLQFFRGDRTEILFPTGGHHRPFLVDFRELRTNRLIRCLFVHPSPGTNTNPFNIQALQSFSEIPEIAPAAGENVPDYCIVAGDFNLNEHTNANDYRPLLARNYIKSFTDAGLNSIYSKNSVPKNYFKAILCDNFLIRQTAGAASATTHKIIDAVEGSPDPYKSVMKTTLDVFKKRQGKENLASFQSWPNFGSIIDTSDHLPIFLEIP